MKLVDSTDAELIAAIRQHQDRFVVALHERGQPFHKIVRVMPRISPDPDKRGVILWIDPEPIKRFDQAEVDKALLDIINKDDGADETVTEQREERMTEQREDRMTEQREDREG